MSYVHTDGHHLYHVATAKGMMAGPGTEGVGGRVRIYLPGSGPKRGHGGGSRRCESSQTLLYFGVFVFVGSEGWALKQLVVPWVNPILQTGPPHSLRLSSGERCIHSKKKKM